MIETLAAADISREDAAPVALTPEEAVTAPASTWQRRCVLCGQRHQPTVGAPCARTVLAEERAELWAAT